MKKVSVVIPTIGRMNYLDKSIESILNQTIPFPEIIIFDNSVEQNIRELSKYCDDTRVIWKKSGKQLDAIDSWNSAVNLASNEYVTIFGDDDMAYKEFYTAILDGLEKANLVLINYDVMDENDNIFINNRNTIENEIVSSADFRYLIMNFKLSTPVIGAIFKKSSFNKAKGYEDTGLPGYAYSDYLLYFKLAIIENKAYLSKKSFWKYRVHSAQIGHVKKAKIYTDSINIYIEKLEKELKNLKVEVDKIYPEKLQKTMYISNIAKAKFIDTIYKLTKVYDIKLILENLIDILEDRCLLDCDKNFIISTTLCDLLKSHILSNSSKNLDFSIQFNKLLSFIENIKQKSSSFAIYGFGHIGKFIVDNLENEVCVIVDKNKGGSKYKDINIIKAENLQNYRYDYIIICVLGREEEIETFLSEELKISKEKLIYINLK